MTDGLVRAGFDLDLRFGQERESVLLRILRGDFKVEVKSDLLCRATGNLFIEYRCNGKPSGLVTTEADYWAFEYYLDERWLFIRTDALRRFADRAYQEGKLARGGDYDRCEGVLVPIVWLLKD